jgi:hypothetical protein
MKITKLTKYNLALGLLICLTLIKIRQQFLPNIVNSEHIVIRPPGVIVKTTDGLGSQLFVYASSFALAKKFDIPLYLVSPSHPSGYTSNPDSNLKDSSTPKFMLDLFDLPMGNWIDENKFSWDANLIMNVNCEDIFYDRISQTQAETKILINVDYCPSEKYFENYATEVKNSLTPNKQRGSLQFLSWKGKIDRVRKYAVPIAVHIRLGDYLQRDHWTAPISFYRTAMAIMEINFNQGETKDVEFFVFSDDINFVKKHLFPEDEVNSITVHFISGGSDSRMSSFEEFVLMTLCQSMIISNSKFSWWAAYLIKESVHKIVIGPNFYPKFLDHLKDKHQRDFKELMWNNKYPEEWIQLDVYNETEIDEDFQISM